MDSVDMSAVAQAVVSSREAPVAIPFVHCRTAANLERGGWHREIAGEEDFIAAVGAFAECAMNPRKGVYVQGDYGCGKTSLVRAALRRTRIETIPVSLATDWERLDPEEWPYFIDELMRCNVVLDDLGAEPPMSCFGVRRELAGEFIVRYHLHGRGRLFVTTNLDGDALLDRYTMRVASRLKDLCIPLILKGGDKRKWLVKGGAA